MRCVCVWFIRMTRRIHMCAMTQSYSCSPHTILHPQGHLCRECHSQPTIHSHVWHDSYTCDTWLFLSFPCEYALWRAMGWLRLVGAIKLQVSFAKETYKKKRYSAKETYNLSILLTVATPSLFLFFSRDNALWWAFLEKERRCPLTFLRWAFLTSTFFLKKGGRICTMGWLQFVGSLKL